MMKPLILVVEDDHAIKNLITTTLETQNYTFHKAATGAQAIVEAVSQHPDVIPVSYTHLTLPTIRLV